MHVNVGTVHPYPGSSLFEYCLNKGKIPDKLAYYNSIDQVCYNMTSLPDEEFSRLMSHITATVNSCAVPMAVTVASRQDTAAFSGETVHNGNRKPWELWFVCPHCSERVYARELLGEEEMAHNCASFVTGCPVCHLRSVVRVIPSVT